MQSLNLTVNPNLITPPAGESHVATSWQVTLYPEFKNDYYHLIDDLFDIVNLTNYSGAVDVMNNDVVYFRNKFHYSDGSSSDWTNVFTYDLIPINDYSQAMVMKTPVVVLSFDYTSDPGMLVLRTDKARFYLGSGYHRSTSWTITDNLDNEIYRNTTDEVNLTSLRLPLDIFEDDKLYKILVKYHSDNNVSSDFGKYILNTFIVKNNYFTAQQGNDLMLDKNLFVRIIPKTVMYSSVDLAIVDNLNNIVKDNLAQHTLFPSIVASGLLLNSTYTIRARLRLRNGSYTPYVDVFSDMLHENLLYKVDNNTSYLNKYDFKHTLPYFMLNAESSVELDNGTILLMRGDSNSIDGWTYDNEELIMTYPNIIELPATDMIGVAYVNVLKLHSGSVLVNYASNSSGLNNQKSVFVKYDHNHITNEFTEVSRVVMEDQWLSTGVSNSAFVDKNDNVYYVPAIDTLDGVEIPLSLYKLDTDTMVSTKVNDLPYVARRNVSITPVSDTEFVVYGGSEERTLLNNRWVYTRDNDNIYRYNPTTGIYTQVAVIGNEVPADFYNFQGYLRRDGKVVMFNSVRDGGASGIQDTLVYDPTVNTVTYVSNDGVDNLLYRSTIALNNGEFLRFSSNLSKVQAVMLYVSESMTAEATDDNVELASDLKDLVVGVGEIIYIESLYDYNSIMIVGNSPGDTGILRVQDAKLNIVTEYTYKDMIMSADGTVDTANIQHTDSVTVLDNIVVTLEDTTGGATSEAITGYVQATMLNAYYDEIDTNIIHLGGDFYFEGFEYTDIEARFMYYDENNTANVFYTPWMDVIDYGRSNYMISADVTVVDFNTSYACSIETRMKATGTIIPSNSDNMSTGMGVGAVE